MYIISQLLTIFAKFMFLCFNHNHCDSYYSVKIFDIVFLKYTSPSQQSGHCPYMNTGYMVFLRIIVCKTNVASYDRALHCITAIEYIPVYYIYIYSNYAVGGNIGEFGKLISIRQYFTYR